MKLALIPISKPTSKKPFDMQAVIEAQLDKEALTILKEFKQTTRTFKTKVNFDTLKKFNERTVYTANQIYFFLVRGTRPHIIRPRKAKVLAFNSVYKAKTNVRVIGSQQGGSSPPVVHAMEVHHPGTDARDFDSVIAARVEKRLAYRMQQAINRAANKST